MFGDTIIKRLCRATVNFLRGRFVGDCDIILQEFVRGEYKHVWESLVLIRGGREYCDFTRHFFAIYDF